jgi:hypothetical protein
VRDDALHHHSFILCALIVSLGPMMRRRQLLVTLHGRATCASVQGCAQQGGCTVHSRAKDLPKQRRALTDMADVAIEAVLRRSGTPPTSVAPNEWLRARSVSLAGGSSTPLAPCRNNPGWREFTRSWLLGWCGKSFSTAARLEGNCRMASPAGECAAFSPARLR